MFSKLISFSILIIFATASFSQTIKFATLAPEGSTWMNVMNEINEEVQEKTDGKVKFKIYAGGVVGEEKDVIRKIRSNQMHSAAFTGVGLGEIMPEVRVMELPFLFRNYEEIDYVNDKMFDHFSAQFEKKGYILLGWAEVGFVRFFSNTPISSVKDLKKTKMWAWEGDPLANATISGLGITPIQLNVSDILTSFQTNLIDAAYASPLGAIALQWHTKVNHVSDFVMADAIGAILVSKRQFRKISPENQKILLDVSKEKLGELVKLSREDNQKSLEAILKSGVTLAPKPTSEATIELEKRGIEIRKELTGKLFSQEILDQVVNYLEDFRNSEQ